MSASTVGKAAASLTDKRMGPIFSSLSKTATGLVMLDRAAERLAKSAHDRIAEGRCEAATAYLMDARLPHISK